MIVFDKIANQLIFHKEITPVNIWKFYQLENDFIFLSTDNVKNIPIMRKKHELLQSICYNYKYSSYHFSTIFDQYAEGFLKGFETEFKPFIQTPENQKELILKSIILYIDDNPFIYKKNLDGTMSLYLSRTSLYRMGEKMGKNYKAWILLLENPKYFQDEYIFTDRLPSLHLALGPFRSMESLYVAAQVKEIIVERHPSHIEHDLLVHKGNFTKWLIENFQVKDDDSEYFMSLLTLKNFQKYLQSNYITSLYLKREVSDTIFSNHQILEVRAHIIWLQQQFSSLKNKDKQTILLNLELKEMNDFIDNVAKIISKNKNRISKSTKKDIISLKKRLDEIEVKNDFSSDKQGKILDQKTKPKPKTFEELFIDSFNKDLHEACIDVLRKINPPLIDSQKNFIGRKGVICVWIRAMEDQEILKRDISKKILVSFLNKKFKNLSIDETIFPKSYKKFEDKYKKDIIDLLSRIKSSTFSKT